MCKAKTMTTTDNKVVLRPHECSWETVVWETVSGEYPHAIYHVAGKGQLLERHGICRTCERHVIEVYDRIGVVDNVTRNEIF